MNLKELENWSPCIAVCTTCFDDVCRGCGRTVDEVAQWVTYGPEQKLLVFQRLKNTSFQFNGSDSTVVE